MRFNISQHEDPISHVSQPYSSIEETMSFPSRPREGRFEVTSNPKRELARKIPKINFFQLIAIVMVVFSSSYLFGSILFYLLIRLFM